MNGDLVHRTSTGRVWHWTRDRKHLGLSTACGGTPVDLAAKCEPARALLEDRCPRYGCVERWRQWSDRAVIAAVRAERDALIAERDAVIAENVWLRDQLATAGVAA